MYFLQSLRHATAALLVSAVAASGVHAEGLQVAPVSVEIPERSGMVWLNNTSGKPIRAQVRVFAWNQDSGEDELVPTQDVIASPPFAEMDAGGQQAIRLVRLTQTALEMQGCEQYYRIIVDELPSQEADDSLGLKYLLRFSVPVYLTDENCAQQEPQLRWQIVRQGDFARLDVVNLGQRRAQIAQGDFIAASGERTQISSGLLGYVLAGSSRSFALAQSPESFAGGGQLEIQINGSRTLVPVALADPSH